MKFTAIGKITSTHGIKGDVKIYPLTDDPDRFFSLEKVYVGEIKELLIPQEVKLHKGMVLLRFKGMEDINQVIRYKNHYVYVLDEDRVKLPDGRFFISDLLECEVVDTSGNLIGNITDVLQSAANDVYVIHSDQGKEFLIPAVERFVVSVDIINKKVVVDPIEGMIE
jgi:16S rRNA processing protein RimM